MLGQPWHKTRPHARLPPSFLLHRCMDDFKRSFDVIHGHLCKQTLTDVRSTDAGIIRLYSNIASALAVFTDMLSYHITSMYLIVVSIDV